MNIEKEITIPELIEQIGDLNIFSYYIPNLVLNRPMLSVFRKEKNPSFVISSRGNQIRYKDYGDSQFKGNCIDLVKQLYHLSTSEAINKIKEDFGLIDKSNVKYNQVISSLPEIEVKEFKPARIIAESKKFCKEHYDYLAKIGLIPEDLNIFSDTEVLALKRFWINGDPYILKKNEVGFIFYVKSLNLTKIYLPQRKKPERRFWSSLPFSLIHGLEDIENCENLIISKSLKEAAILKKYLGVCVIVTQAENDSAIRDKDIQVINSKAKNVYTNFDSDAPGQKASKLLNERTNWKWVNVPNKYLEEGIKDWGELMEKYGIEPIRNHFIEKKIIKQ